MLASCADARQRVARNHQFLVRRDDPYRYGTVGGADSRPPAEIGGRIEASAQPSPIFADARPDGSSVLADTGREHEDVEAAQRGRERTEVTTDPIHEEIDRVGRLAGGTREQLAHVVADARYAEESGSMVEKIGDLVDAHA